MKQAIDLTGFVNINGAPIIPGGPSFTPNRRSASEGLKAVERREEAKESNGFRVVGYPPGAIAQAEEFAAKRLADWQAKTSEQQADCIKQGQRAPAPWTLDGFLKSTKPKNVRSRPYELADAAETCAQLARKAGWEYVAVVEMLRG